MYGAFFGAIGGVVAGFLLWAAVVLADAAPGWFGVRLVARS
jgi:hypothetical protein